MVSGLQLRGQYFDYSSKPSEMKINEKFESRWGAIRVMLLAILLTLCLFGDFPGLGASAFGGVLPRVKMILQDPEIQWMVFGSLIIYSLIFLILFSRHDPQRFWRLSNLRLWLAVGLGIATLHYVAEYTTALRSLQALKLVAGVAIGSATAAACGRSKRTVNEASAKEPGGESPYLHVVVILVVLLTLASFWQKNSNNLFKYHDRMRWMGPWDNPNIFGLLMGTGILLALGLAVGKWSLKARPRRILAFFCLFGMLFMGRALYHSYSRGAWLATVAGFFYLVGCWLRIRRFRAAPEFGEHAALEMRSHVSSSKISAESFVEPAIRGVQWNRLPLLLLASSLLVLLFWNYQQTNFLAARRVLSVANGNDFSWRNRVAAWEGSLQIAAERPLWGVGWDRSTEIYDEFYRVPAVPEELAINMNDYLMLCTTLGIPAMFCFVVYIAGGLLDISKHNWMQMVCRAGALVLAIGFWFDGGLFSQMATGSAFWILLELGMQISVSEMAISHKNRPLRPIR